MPLVTYSDSDEDQESSEPAAGVQRANVTAPKRKRSASPPTELPPLPTSFHDLYATNVRTGVSDDPSLHNGRKRQIPHLEGNWPTHVYLEWHPGRDAVRLLQGIVDRATDASSTVHTLLQSDLGAPLPLHVSLSRSLALHTDQREAFLSRVRGHVAAAAVRAFDVRFTKVAWYPNHERNRWFLSLGVRRPGADELNRLLGACNDACREMRQPELYVPPRDEPENAQQGRSWRQEASRPRRRVDVPDCSEAFHVSLAWSLEPQRLAGGLQEISPDELADLSTHFDCVKVKIGNTVSSLPLHATKVSSSQKWLLT
ncbi:uncharacterized protein PV09_07511 [Verruconis gallopava]|uniref:U6 snRNA phosphodiesterase n=1 Tax=Verruconis gallopava TaxID=253628 RepID=A0A0D1YJF3_9PEZI|nr:uncharacterized protein PV09_07511 [Verruconis gallopava]KIW00992.1 hypothetical protein PV09_07511 [Verruconis gallopava]